MWLDLTLQKCFEAGFQKIYRGKCRICLNVATA